jgi:3-hydroxymyristoyl/3-hydroxydecanoyl-(acyl carrier protein) dehydratase
LLHSSTVTVAVDHPAFTGHFPQAPILPGVVLLDAVLQAVAASGRYATNDWQVSSAKFHHVVTPGETLCIEHEATATGSVKFRVASGDQTVASGMLAPA